MSNNQPDRNRPGYNKSGNWIGYENWGQKMSYGRGIGGFIGILMIIGIIYFIIRPTLVETNSGKKLREIQKEKATEERYIKSNFFFPELDTLIIYKSTLKPNPIIDKYQKYGKNWRLQFCKDNNISDLALIDDLIDGTTKRIDKNGKYSTKRLKELRYHHATIVEKDTKIKIGQLQEAKRVIEDGEEYIWNKN